MPHRFSAPLLITLLLSLRSILAQPLTVTTLAGRLGYPTSIDGVGIKAAFLGVHDQIAADASGNVYVIDGQCIRKIAPDQTVSTFAGKPYIGGNADGHGSSALFDFLDNNVEPGDDIAVDTAGNLYVADTGNMVIRKVTPQGDVTTFAGNGSPGHTDGPVASAEFYNPQAIAVDLHGNVYVVDNDTFPNGPSIRKISGGTVTTLAGGSYGFSDGTGADARFQTATGLAVDSSGTVYIADDWGIRKMSPTGTVTTWVGSPSNTTETDGLLANAGFGSGALKIALDGTGGAYVTDGDTVRYVSSLGAVTTAAGSVGQTATTTNDGTGADARFVKAYGIAVDLHRNVYISDVGGDTILKAVPPSLPPINSFSENPGPAPVRSSNPWKFSAIYSTVVSDLRLRVQSSPTPTLEGSWTDLPGLLDMTDIDGTWTLNKNSDVPTGTVYFRVVASAPGYVDSKSNPAGPETVLPGFNPWGYFSYATTVPYTTATPWGFAITQTSQIPGMALRIQSSATPDQAASWTDLPGGNMTRYSDGKNWLAFTTNVPVGNISFRVVASASNYADSISGTVGPFQIGLPLSQISTNATQGGTYTLQDFNLFGAIASGLNYVVHTVGVALHLIPAQPTTSSPQSSITLTADSSGTTDLTIAKGQVLTAAGVNVGVRSKLIVSGTVNADVSVGVVSNDGGSVVSNDGGSVVSNDGGSVISNDGGSVISNDGGSFAQDDVTARLADEVLNDPSLIRENAAEIISQDGSGIISQDGSGIISQDGSGLVSKDGIGLGGDHAVGLLGQGGATGLGAPNSSAHLSDAIAALRNPRGVLASAPPFQPAFTGQMNVNGNYSQFGGTELIVGIAGTSTLSQGAQQFDQLIVNGQATLLNGTIVFQLLNPNDQTNRAGVFQPPAGSTFDVVVATNIVANGVHIRGPVWGNGLFFSGSVVQRPDGLQALRLTTTSLAPTLFVAPAGPNFHLLYGTNYTGYAIQSSSTLGATNWTTLSSATNVLSVPATNAHQYFRLFHP